MHISFVRILKNNARYGKINAYIFVPIKILHVVSAQKGILKSAEIGG